MSLRVINLDNNTWRYMYGVNFNKTGPIHLFTTMGNNPDMRFYPTVIICETLVATGKDPAFFTIGTNPPLYKNIMDSGETRLQPFELAGPYFSLTSIAPNVGIWMNITRRATSVQSAGRIVVLGYYSNPNE